MSKTRDCRIRDRKEIKISRTKTITVTRSGEWGGKHVLVVEEVIKTSVTTKFTEKKRENYDNSKQCILDFNKTIRNIEREYKDVMHF